MFETEEDAISYLRIIGASVGEKQINPPKNGYQHFNSNQCAWEATNLLIQNYGYVLGDAV
jgi:hypothetical protein